MDIYREKLLDHYNNPRNYGAMEGCDTSVELENVSCGDLIKVQLNVEEGVIREAKFTGEGCAVAIASASILTEYMRGKKLQEITELTLEGFIDLIGVELTLSRIKCANLSLEAAKIAIKQLTGKET
jgi:nitrogen fixation NifU-like protein